MSKDSSETPPKEGSHPNEPDYVEGEQVGNKTEGEGAEMSPKSPSGDKNFDGAAEPSTFDGAMNILALLLLAAVFVASVTCIAGCASLLSSISATNFSKFSIYYGLGVSGVVIGCVCLVGVIAVLLFIAMGSMGLRRYGMCCAGGSGCSTLLSVLLMAVLPIFILIVLLIFTIIGFTLYSVGRQLPPYNKHYNEVPGLIDSVYITRDSLGLPHIRASSRRDAYFGQGFAEAQDRLFQLEFHRLVGRGDLASTIADDGLETDILLRTVNLRDSAISLCSNAKPQDRDYFQAFADGVNLYLKKESRRPPEFFYMSTKTMYFHDPKPFTAIDVCVTARVLQFQMSSNMDAEGERISLMLKGLSYQRVTELYQDQRGLENTILTAEQLNITDDSGDSVVYNNAEDTAVRNEGGILDGAITALLGLLAQFSSKHDYAGMHERIDTTMNNLMSSSLHSKKNQIIFANKFILASNSWAVRDSSNRSMGASDPHLTINLPSVWYYSHLTFPSGDGVMYDIAGVGMVGLPGVHIGKSTYVSWGITMSMTDLEDLIVIMPDLNDILNTSYVFKNKLFDYSHRTERIKVKGKNDLVLDVKDSIFGPVVSAALGFPTMVNVALWARPLQHDDSTSVAGLLGMSDPATKNTYAMMEVLRKVQAPGFSIPIADYAGNIGYVVTGLHPKRSPIHTGKFPVLSTYNMVNMEPVHGTTFPEIPMLESPHYYSEANGAAFHISAANQKIYPDSYKYHLGYEFAYPHRGRRIQERLAAATPEQLIDPNFHKELQTDSQSNMWAYDFKPIVASWTDAMLNDDANAIEWRDRLVEWDSKLPVGSVEGAFFWRWYQRCSVFPLATVASGRHNTARHRYLARSLSSSPPPMSIGDCWKLMNDNTTTCMDFVIREFISISNSNFNEKWGVNLNVISSLHEMADGLSYHPMYQRFMQKSGDTTSVGVSGNSMEGNMDSHHAASQRSIYDWQKRSTMHFVLPGGNNGNPYSKYYDNMWDTYQRNEYFEVRVLDENRYNIDDRVSHNVLSPY